jgi:aryl-alcohol dehydrogenase-like predicted oxidoreductase
VLAKGVVPIPGTKRQKYLEENLGGLAVSLAPEEVARLDTLFPAGAARGERYGAAAAALLDR